MPNRVTGDDFWFEKYPEANCSGYVINHSIMEFVLDNWPEYDRSE